MFTLPLYYIHSISNSLALKLSPLHGLMPTRYSSRALPPSPYDAPDYLTDFELDGIWCQIATILLALFGVVRTSPKVTFGSSSISEAC